MVKILYTTNGTRSFTAPGETVIEGWSRGAAGTQGYAGSSGSYIRNTYPAGSVISIEMTNSYTRYRVGSGTWVQANSATVGAGAFELGRGGTVSGPFDVGYPGQQGYADGGGVQRAGNSPLPDGSYATETTEDGGRGAYYGFGSAVPPGAPSGGGYTTSQPSANAGARGQIRIIYTEDRKNPRSSSWL